MGFIIFALGMVYLFVLVLVFSHSEDAKKIDKEGLVAFENSKAADGYNRGKTIGSFTNMTQCRSCKSTDEYWSQHPSKCCPYCGGIVGGISQSGIYLNGTWYHKENQ